MHTPPATTTPETTAAACRYLLVSLMQRLEDATTAETLRMLDLAART